MADEPTDPWPADLRGVTESVVATLGPNDRWNLAALGLHAPDGPGEGVTAKTYGRTRTWRNFTARGEGVVQFVTDPRDFVDAALTVREADGPVLDSADAWLEVRVEQVGREVLGGSDPDAESTTVVREWALAPTDAGVETEGVRIINRGFNAVVDGTVAASRLGVPGYDEGDLLARLDYFADVVERCGGPAEREAWAALVAASEYRPPDQRDD